MQEQFCPVNCEVYSDGCYTCVCDRDGFNPICDTTECVETGQPECLCEYAHSKCEPEDRICAVYLRDEKGCETCACELYLDSVDTSKGDLMTVEGVCPDDCEMYFDGCNFCICGDFAGCTLKKCTPYETTDPFCIDDYADNEPSTPLYITPDDNDLVNCPIYLCTISCLYGYQQTDNGCNACACKPKPDCPELDCPACDTSLMVDDTGCSTCDCFVQKCPEGCNQYSDGCNTFLCLEDQGMEKQTNITCVREEYHAAACLEGAEIAIPENCRRWFDGCNQCMVDLDGTVITCSTRQCTVLRDAQCVMYYHDDDEISTNSAGNPRVDGDIVEMNDSAFVGVGRYPSVGKEEAITPSVDD
ncbi:hypothetical protein SARC_08452 [Sphaeroforma arctica JP610]|uniref:Antistasin-like domain-containing protein n=1 Tax=Sphaeroforma arctica JP610 TaxID=667725 RepID=A0A0L0FR34_9EUKA|nr:hypothetical protein SARC_08452 [Sphaeroforma arctica JP610]KNC79144.1 hypothetical protein SARC_08452 [Sphaeroforma arctica JP610]|eukprot:XP_014153046.1 hypothetical protein SARC_08452 [Sphaeroforma arctica JP610]